MGAASSAPVRPVVLFEGIEEGYRPGSAARFPQREFELTAAIPEAGRLPDEGQAALGRVLQKAER
jgi:hypothetical protein